LVQKGSEPVQKRIAALTDPIITKATFIVIPSKMTPTREAHARARAANNYPRNLIQQASGVLLKRHHHCRRGDLDCFGSFLLAVQPIPKTSMFSFCTATNQSVDSRFGK
jgi:hypothetical protein